MVFSFPSTDADMSEILFVSDHACKNCLVKVLLAELFFFNHYAKNGRLIPTMKRRKEIKQQ